MKTLGVSITHDRLSAVVWESSLFSPHVVFSCEVSCRELHVGQEDAAGLADEVRKGIGAGALPPAVLSIPPSWTYLRQVELPVQDLARARKIHLSELEGSLPIEDEAILSDILPSPPGQPGKFQAIAARREAVEKTVAVFSEAGFRIDRVVTDHVSILAALLSSGAIPEGFIVSTLSDLVVMRTDGGAVRRARQFPAAMASDTAVIAREWKEMLAAESAPGGPLPVTLLGEAPAALAGDLAGAAVFRLPGNPGDTSILAYGAARASSFAKGIGGFSLRTSAEAESEQQRRKQWVRIAAASAAAAVVSCLIALEVAQWTQGKKVAAVRAQIRKEFSEAAPGSKAAAQETAQIRGKIQALRRQQKEMGIEAPGLSASLAKVSQALPLKENISVRDVSFESGKMRLAGEAGGAQQVEKFRTALAAAFGPDMNVTLQESQGSAKGGTIRFTILIEKGGAGRAS